MDRKARTVTEKARKLPVAGEYDVVVAGGGIAGVAAAIAASRAGRTVALLEKTCSVGGLATLGNVTIWLPLCDGRGRQVTAGLPEELLKLSVADLGRNNPTAQFAGIPTCWHPGGSAIERKKTRYLTKFNPASYSLALEKLALESGVKFLYDTRVCAVAGDDHRIKHLAMENKSGRSALACRMVIDASGDADICHMAGEKTESLNTNVLTGWFYYFNHKNLHVSHLSNAYDPNAGTKGAKGPFFSGDDAEQVTVQILETRDLIRKRLKNIRRREPDADAQIINLPGIPCLRMTRRLVSDFSPGAKHVHQWFNDTIGLTGDWRERGPVYAIPWRSIRAVKSRNLLVAGRCISVDKSLWDVTRAIPGCSLTGAAAGVAASLAIEKGRGNVHSLSVPELQDRLNQQGFLLDPDLVGP